ncbi:uncharacterized protein J3D65DRAFT_680536 [Phyllosticta citribraziliensis]|uniref:RRM domain-containing protein n=1 Tax=Phyllosticta citribraziliensis TaxID=989973 RepID=A0ABR1L8N3_9PEZI
MAMPVSSKEALLESLFELLEVEAQALPDKPSKASPPTAAVEEPAEETLVHPSISQPETHINSTTAAVADEYTPHQPSSIPSDSESEPEAFYLPPAPEQRLDLRCGDYGPDGESYIYISLASKFPYKFLSRDFSEKVAKKFFDRNQFWNRGWDLFYIYSEPQVGGKPLVLITLTQFQELIRQINSKVRNLDFQLTDYYRDCGFIIDIPHPGLTPRYLGFSASRDEYSEMERTVPPVSYNGIGNLRRSPPDMPTLEAFKEMIEESLELNKAKNKANKARRKENRVLAQHNWGRSFRRTQRYLGVRPGSPSPSRSNPSPAEGANASKHPPINVDEASPYPFEKNVVFVSVDVEAYEMDNSKITEVGVATLDVQDIINKPPGKNAENWYDLIRARHYRIDEHAHLVNYRHVDGCPDGFLFGESEFVRLNQAPRVVAACFRPPFSADLTPEQAQAQWSADAKTSDWDEEEKRNIIFVAHDPDGDIRFLQKLGYNPLNLSNLIDKLDTKQLHQHWKRDTQGTSLARILCDCDIIGWRLHNGGNDAVYTMQALLAICVQEAASRGTKELAEERKKTHDRRLSEALAETVARVQDEAEGWSSDGEDDSAGNFDALAQAEASNSGSPFDRSAPNTTSGGSTPTSQRKVFVGNLSLRATDSDIANFFHGFGNVTDVLMLKHKAGASRGSAIVTFASAADAQHARSAGNNTVLHDRMISVQTYMPKPKPNGNSTARSKSGQGASVPGNWW